PAEEDHFALFQRSHLLSSILPFLLPAAIGLKHWPMKAVVIATLLAISQYANGMFFLRRS
ncbi:MAG TPA: hypothetical protein VFK30_08030, partial [Anaerolineae bacterium]|nr:hypothetical protein [Anaerolineae bacterium]